MKINITMFDDTELREVNLFRSKELGDSIVTTKFEINELLDFDSNKTVWFSGDYVQGSLIPQRIQEYEIVDDTQDVLKELDKFIKDNQDIWDINVPDVRDFIFENREKLLKILR